MVREKILKHLTPLKPGTRTDCYYKTECKNRKIFVKTGILSVKGEK